jgi:hypothetical protein
MSFETDDSAQSMLWATTEDRLLTDPERQLLDAIAPGELDEHLVAIADALHARRQLLHTVRSARAIAAKLRVGDTVIFTNRIRPRYLEHELAEVTEVDDCMITVRLWRPVGRFGERDLRCPPLALRRLDRGTSIRDSQRRAVGPPRQYASGKATRRVVGKRNRGAVLAASGDTGAHISTTRHDRVA